ncbi:SAM-dependent DNA methyltransferase [Mucilaginibacter rubeus]|uniref:site-specific DNA-methyltransferase (adenine-specific) n=1 Tax=Mucilaginibacter rubeus TaxID=2027860 RepID=A0AAE6ML00_9SPHI|nr:class I SAM-dependent DNA methyltransferase [Mucilaginibacter rubeus]QEM07250.1 SAM-dependent DNA methyltransferase [Mucilaginibacter rubeus]QTE43597.1 SAM-dependent DNA methyltransferase [Mucilaginibacter rubeus]QTE50197.1 SAM-dependent DNA methyltransferase [Mucilaginibacter rubeus]QTE55285.1 SAM-dependent DNA methyltransferase [Mucilaginibacter rubeus]QTE65256.1 SAM-dependent DNA methyltransferase [Mucilaginibacter rubeus]
MKANTLVSKIWTFCNTLRDDGLGYGDYLEQLTYLLFLKMADENPGEYDLPSDCDWSFLKDKEKGDLIGTYEDILKGLSRSGGMLEKIFAGAQNRIHDSFKLKKLIKLIDEENWTSKNYDLKGEIYESLLQKNAENSGAGQYFTPRPIISAVIECIRPVLGETIADPACGTGGFFLGALESLSRLEADSVQKEFIKFHTFKGWEIESSTARLCLMNLFLHGLGDLKETPDIEIGDSLKSLSLNKVDIVLANPPFGKSSSDIPTPDLKLSEKDGYYLRSDFWVTTSNKQLAFLQHIYSLVKENGRAAVVLPDNVLFEGGPGEIIRTKLLDLVNLHTILRLPTGIFYAQGVNANVLFFEKKSENSSPATKNLWYYDYRTNIRHTPKKNPLTFENLKDFINCYLSKERANNEQTWSESNPLGRWRKYTYDELISREKVNLDISWLQDENLIDFSNMPDPEDFLNDIIENIESALRNFKTIRENWY